MTLRHRLRMRFVLHWSGGFLVTTIPPAWPNRFRIRRTKFRTKLYALNYGGSWRNGSEHGIAYEWLGVRMEIGKKS